MTEHDGRRSSVLMAFWAGLAAFCAAGVVLSAVTGQQGWATVSVTATGLVLVLVTRLVDRLTERGRRVLDVVAVILFAAVLAGVVVLLAVTDGFADAWYLVVLTAVALAGVVLGARARRRRETDAPPRVEAVRRAGRSRTERTTRWLNRRRDDGSRSDARPDEAVPSTSSASGRRNAGPGRHIRASSSTGRAADF